MRNQAVSDLTLERYILGELPDDEMKVMDQLCQDDDELKHRIYLMEQSNREILRAYPINEIAQKIERLQLLEKKRNSYKQNNKKGKHFLVPALAAMSLAVIVISIPAVRNILTPWFYGEETIRMKGGSSLLVYRKISPGRTELLDEHSSARAGDLLQLAYRVEGNHRYGIILSVDGRGNATLHFPLKGESAKLEPGKTVPLVRAYQLDDAPGFERFYFFILNENPDAQKVFSSFSSMVNSPEFTPSSLPGISFKNVKVFQVEKE